MFNNKFILFVFVLFFLVTLVSAENFTLIEELGAGISGSTKNMEYQPAVSALINQKFGGDFFTGDVNLSRTGDVISYNTQSPLFFSRKADLLGTMFWEENSGSNSSTGTYAFDGIDDVIVFGGADTGFDPSCSTQKNSTSFITINSTNNTGVRSIYSINSSLDFYHMLYLNQSNLMYGFFNSSDDYGTYSFNTSYQIDEKEVYTILWRTEADSSTIAINITVKNKTNTTKKMYHDFAIENYIVKSDTDSLYLGARGIDDPDKSFFQGNIEYFQSFCELSYTDDNFLNEEDSSYLLNNPDFWLIYPIISHYTNNFSVGNFSSLANSSLWTSLNITNGSIWLGSGDIFVSSNIFDYTSSEPYIMAQARAGDCGEKLDGVEWINSTRINTTHYFDENVVGECLESRILFENTNYTTGLIFYNYSVSGREIFSTEINDLGLNYSSLQIGSILIGNISVIPNNTELVNVIFNWYVNDNLNYSEIISGISVNSSVQSNFSTINLSVNDIVNFTVQADSHGGGLSEILESSSLTISADKFPSWELNNTNNPTDNSSLYEFNITAIDTIAVDTVLLESNYSGNRTNYTMNLFSGSTKDGVYNFSSFIPSGSFYWKVYINDSSGNINETDTWIFSVIEFTESVSSSSTSSSGGNSGGSSGGTIIICAKDYIKVDGFCKKELLIENSNEKNESINEGGDIIDLIENDLLVEGEFFVEKSTEEDKLLLGSNNFLTGLAIANFSDDLITIRTFSLVLTFFTTIILIIIAIFWIKKSKNLFDYGKK